MSEMTPIEPGDAILPGNPPTVSRYRLGTRINHWIGAVTMVLLILSGLSMFHPSLFFLSVIFGGGQNTRALHPWFGVVLVLSFIALFVQFWRLNLWNRSDITWIAHFRDLMAGHEEKMPEVGKYNAGQKFIFWAMALLILAMFCTGIIIWDRYFEHLTSIPTQRLALLSHAICATFAILVLILHVSAGIWVRGSFDAMIKGWVTAGWAYRHHRRWFRRLADEANQKTGPAE
jgi:formate dehydrogenase subunit gamma